MTVTVDTNVLLRAAVRDDPAQAKQADQLLQRASRVVITSVVLCEFAWVLGRVYGFDRGEVGVAMQGLLQPRNVSTNVPAIEAGLLTLSAGGDFADGVIAYEGKQAGGDVFASFDKQAVRLARKQGFDARPVSASSLSA